MTKRLGKKRQTEPSRPARHMTSVELRAITFVSTLILAGIAIVLRINDPVVWSFLATAIGITIGQAIQRQ